MGLYKKSKKENQTQRVWMVFVGKHNQPLNRIYMHRAEAIKVAEQYVDGVIYPATLIS